MRIFSRKYATSVRILVTFFTIMVSVLILPKGSRFRYEFDRGKVWLYNDLSAPFSFPIRKSAQQIKIERTDVLKSVIPVYHRDKKIINSALKAFEQDFELQMKSRDPNERQIKQDYLITTRYLDIIYKRGIVFLNAQYQKNSQDYAIQLVDNNLATITSTADLFTLQRAIQLVKKEISSGTMPNKDLILNLVENHLEANVTYDDALTKEMEKEALNNIAETQGMVEKGELIVAKGSFVNEAIYQKLLSLKIDYEEKVFEGSSLWVIALGQFLIVSLSLIIMILFIYIFRNDIYKDIRKSILIQFVFIFMLAILSWAIGLKFSSLYYIPYCIVPIIIRLLFDSRVALNIHLMVVMVAGFFVPNGFEFVFIQMTTGMIAIYSLRNLIRRSQYLFSALMILFTYFVGFVAISIIHQGSFKAIIWADFIPFVVSAILSLLAYPLIYLFEKVFDITSELSLMELTNTNNPLLRDLAFKAPGTFQHSMQVANLAEAAAFKIGGSALLIRAGALYHDIGKMRAPQFFIENLQKEGTSPHEGLSFEESARIIIKHVPDGIEIARRNNLPEIIIDFIKTHHGSTRVDYFYQSFLKSYPESKLNEKIWRYPGPIPLSKETALLMLADSVEAASRTLKDPDAYSISELVDRIINYKIDQNQLINSDISFKDITRIRKIFKEMLMGIYHVRIEYELLEPYEID